jgi:hypothetical protein
VAGRTRLERQHITSKNPQRIRAPVFGSDQAVHIARCRPDEDTFPSPPTASTGDQRRAHLYTIIVEREGQLRLHALLERPRGKSKGADLVLAPHHLQGECGFTRLALALQKTLDKEGSSAAGKRRHIEQDPGCTLLSCSSALRTFRGQQQDYKC